MSQAWQTALVATDAFLFWLILAIGFAGLLLFFISVGFLFWMTIAIGTFIGMKLFRIIGLAFGKPRPSQFVRSTWTRWWSYLFLITLNLTLLIIFAPVVLLM